MENLYYRGKTTWETCCVKNTVTGGGENIHNRVKKKNQSINKFSTYVSDLEKATEMKKKKNTEGQKSIYSISPVLFFFPFSIVGGRRDLKFTWGTLSQAKLIDRRRKRHQEQKSNRVITNI